jgi:hypothetical protein
LAAPKGEPVELVGDQNVAPPERFQRPPKAGAIFFASRQGAVFVLARDGIVFAAAIRAAQIKLGFDGIAIFGVAARRKSRINNGPNSFLRLIHISISPLLKSEYGA